MKRTKFITVLVATLLGGAAASAQPEWIAGFGYGRTDFYGEECSSFLSRHPLQGFYAGVGRDFFFSALAGLTFEPGVYFHYRSARNEPGGTAGDEVSPKYIKMHYLSVPLRLKYAFDLVQGSVTAAVFTGPVFNVGVAGNIYRDDIPDLTTPLTRLNAQWDVGLAATVAGAIEVRLGYAFGLSRLIPEQEIRCGTFTVGAGLLF